MVGHLINRQIPPDVRTFLNWWFKPAQYPHTRHDRALEAHGVYSIAAYVNAWNQHVKTCTRVIPPERRLILRTHELKQSHQRIAEFLQVPPESLDAQNGHVNQGTWTGRLDSLVDASYLSEVVNSIRDDSMARYFPEVSEIEDAYGLWDDPGVGRERPAT